MLLEAKVAAHILLLVDSFKKNRLPREPGLNLALPLHKS